MQARFQWLCVQHATVAMEPSAIACCASVSGWFCGHAEWQEQQYYVCQVGKACTWRRGAAGTDGVGQPKPIRQACVAQYLLSMLQLRQGIRT